MMGNIGILRDHGRSCPLAIIRYFATTAKGELGTWFRRWSLRSSRPAIMFGADVPADRQPQHAQRRRRHSVRRVHVGPAAASCSCIGMVLAQLYRSRDRARYEGIGRYLHEDVATSGD